jgi:hypothetical protein
MLTAVSANGKLQTSKFSRDEDNPGGLKRAMQSSLSGTGKIALVAQSRIGLFKRRRLIDWDWTVPPERFLNHEGLVDFRVRFRRG